MSGRDRDSKSVSVLLKDLFKRKGHLSNHPGKYEYTLTQDCLRDMGKDIPLAVRLKVLKDITTVVEQHKLADCVIEKIWGSIEDLLIKENSTETRHCVFSFLQSLIKGQFDRLPVMRAVFFRLIKEHDNPEDIAQRLDLLKALTSNGKVIVTFEEEIGKFLLQWFPDIVAAGIIEEFLPMIDNVIKFNAAYLDDEVINGIIQHICILCPISKYTTNVLCLQIVHSIVAYTNMSPDALPKFIGVLCRSVVVEKYCQKAWQIMKNLLGTHMGHSAIYTMCRILQEPSLRFHVDLLRGAVFCIRMGLWTIEPLGNLQCSPSSILPSFLMVVKSNQQGPVAFEVILAIQQLINKYGLELMDSSWSVILAILSHINLIANTENRSQIPLKSMLAETLTIIENYIETNHFYGNLKTFYGLVEECALDRPDESIFRLLMYLKRSLNPTNHTWLVDLNNFMSKYFKPEFRVSVRLKVLEILTDIIKLNRLRYEDELIEKIIIPHLTPVVHETDVSIKCSVIMLLKDICALCETKKCLDILDILEKFLFYHYEKSSLDQGASNESPDFSDAICLVKGLISLFTLKIHKLPSAHAIKIYKMLVVFLERHYEKPRVFEGCKQLRKSIFDCFLDMRADSFYHLGCPDSSIKNKINYSPYLCVVYRSTDKAPIMGGSPGGPQSPASAATTTQQLSITTTCQISSVSVRRAFIVFIVCLKQEKDWEVLSSVLRGIAKGLQNKSLILGEGNNELDFLVDTLSLMLAGLGLPESLNVKVSKPDFHAAVLTVMVNLTSYHPYFDQPHQQKLIRALMKCMHGGPKIAKLCISAFTVCTVEMRKVMVKMLPDVLLALSKISSTVHIAVPILEFLSTLTQLQAIYSNFIADQYMAVFAISLPYTNPFKYNHYIVSLAYHVIAVWFLKCRLPFRRDFVRFITNGLQANLIPYEETSYLKSDLSSLNQDSSDRKRSSSLTEQGSRNRDSRGDLNLSVRMDSKKKGPPNKILVTFYEELTETCIDLMARYAFSPWVATPRRSPGAEFLLSGGQSMSWLVGTQIVTITTSGCSQKVLKDGICDKCWELCHSKLGGAANAGADKGLLTASGSSGSTETSRQNSNEKSSNSVNSPQDESASKFQGFGEEGPAANIQRVIKKPPVKPTCCCWCQGWAEVHIRRATGDLSWVMRIQSEMNWGQWYDFPLNEISGIYMPSLIIEASRPQLTRQDTFDHDNHSNHEEEGCVQQNDSATASPKQSPSRQNSQDSIEEEIETSDIYDDGTSKSRNPVRRSNSSPEMSAGWKNPFLKMGSSGSSDEEKNNSTEDKKNKLFPKDMRVSCEAIPEEIAGTTPPQPEPMFLKQTSLGTAAPSNLHPTLLSHHSYPGSSPPKESNIAPKPYQTVPPSPNVPSSTSGVPAEFPKRPTNLPMMSNLMPVTGKPPQSPTQTSPRLPRHVMAKGQEIQKSSSSSTILDRNKSHLIQARERAKERKNTGSVERLYPLDSNQAQTRDRSHTISVIGQANRGRPQPMLKTKETPKSGISPSFVFLQLYHSAYFGIKPDEEKPLLISHGEMVQRAIKILDMVHPYETHNIGVLYVREGQINNETEILRNQFGSYRYIEFLSNLGTLGKLDDIDPKVFHLGGLDQSGGDGKFIYYYHDDIVRITFHVATMMPNKETDQNCNDKKRHIGNDFVKIVYNESGEDYDLNTIKCQFNFAVIIVEPLDHNTNRVSIKVKEEMQEFLQVGESKVVSDQNVAVLARQLALHANLASLVARSLKVNKNDPYASNWLERLRKLKSLRHKILQEQKNQQEKGSFFVEDKSKRVLEDFVDYT